MNHATLKQVLKSLSSHQPSQAFLCNDTDYTITFCRLTKLNLIVQAFFWHDNDLNDTDLKTWFSMMCLNVELIKK